MELRKNQIIDAKYGNITGQYSEDKVILAGMFPNKDSKYAENIELILNRDEDTAISISFPYSGYDMQLFVGDFIGDKKSQIMVRGGFGGTGGFEIAVIYKYENGKLIEIFNQNQFYEKNICKAKYKDNYKVSVNCGKGKYLIDISKKPKDYLDNIYSIDKKVNTSSAPYVDAPSGIYPIKQVYNDYYQLLIQQRIIGQSNADTLGIVQTLTDLLDSKLKILNKGVLVFNENQRIDFSKDKSMKNKRNDIYYGEQFFIKSNSLDLIINSIKEDRNTLYVDGYLLNLTNAQLNQITNFKLGLMDSKGRLFAQKTFDNVDISGGLSPYQGKRVLFSFFSNEYSLFDVDTNNLTWNYTYNFRDK